MLVLDMIVNSLRDKIGFCYICLIRIV